MTKKTIHDCIKHMTKEEQKEYLIGWNIFLDMIALGHKRRLEAESKQLKKEAS